MILNEEYFKEIINFYRNRSKLDIKLEKIKLIRERKVNEIINIYYYNFIENSITIDFKLIINRITKKSRIVKKSRHIKTVFHFKNKKLHGFPAIVEKNKKQILSKYCYKKGFLHNKTAPAIIKGNNKEFWIEGKKYPSHNAYELFLLQTKIQNF